MRWRDYLAVMAGLMLISWLRTIWSPSADVATGAFVAVIVAGSVIERVIRRRRLERLAGLNPEQREVEVELLPASEAARGRLAFGLSFEHRRLAELPSSRTFQYRPGSRSLNSWLFWLCVATAGLMLAPIALGPATDPGQMLPWIILSVIVLVSAGGYRMLGGELGAEVVVDPRGIRLIGTVSQDQSLDWLEIAIIRWLVAPGAIYRGLELRSSRNECLLLDSRIPAFDELVEYVVSKLAAIYPRAMAAVGESIRDS